MLKFKIKLNQTSTHLPTFELKTDNLSRQKPLDKIWWLCCFIERLSFMFSVYILYSEITQKYYTCQTQNFENRIIEHNAGETKSIKNGIVWKVIWTIDLETRKEVVALENKIKMYGTK